MLAFRRVRKFGAWSGDGEIEAVCMDDDAGGVHYSDEQFGIRTYHADPDHLEANWELGAFGLGGFADDREGIALAKQDDGSGMLIVSDQGASRFRAFDLSKTVKKSPFGMGIADVLKQYQLMRCPVCRKAAIGML